VAHQRPGRSPPAWVANRKGNGRLTLKEDATAFFVAFDKADSDKDDLLSYLEIETCWRNSNR
jgi:hypothetical protein